MKKTSPAYEEVSKDEEQVQSPLARRRNNGSPHLDQLEHVGTPRYLAFLRIIAARQAARDGSDSEEENNAVRAPADEAKTALEVQPATPPVLEGQRRSSLHTRRNSGLVNLHLLRDEQKVAEVTTPSSTPLSRRRNDAFTNLPFLDTTDLAVDDIMSPHRSITVKSGKR